MSTKNYIVSKKPIQFSWRGIEIFIHEQFLEKTISMKTVLDMVSKEVPMHLFRGLDAIYVGNFDFLHDRSLNALFKDGAIFLANSSTSEDDIADDIVHELAHLAEREFADLIYGSGEIKREFLQKREALHFMIKDEGYDISLSYFLDTEYNKNFDMFLYQEVGYPTLSMLTVNLFYSPYGATSLREYFANCFEGYFWDKDISRIEELSPRVFDKLNILAYYPEEKK